MTKIRILLKYIRGLHWNDDLFQCNLFLCVKLVEDKEYLDFFQNLKKELEM